MNKQDALRQLIKVSRLDQKTSTKMLSQVDAMSDEDVDALGKALAEQIAKDTAAAKRAVIAIDEALAQNP